MKFKPFFGQRKGQQYIYIISFTDFIKCALGLVVKSVVAIRVSTGPGFDSRRAHVVFWLLSIILEIQRLKFVSGALFAGLLLSTSLTFSYDRKPEFNEK